ncbi:hypothetical protein V6N13_008993 [Hibiscus sabdariffa]
MIEDEELFLMLEELDWSYLKEIFVEINLWSKSFKTTETATWLEVSGMPLHCWNLTTFKRVVELWGTFEEIGENAWTLYRRYIKPLNGGVKLGNKLCSAKQRVGERVKPSVTVKLDSTDGDCSSEPTSDSVRSRTPVSTARVNCLETEKTINAICMGKSSYADTILDNRDVLRHVGERN